MKKKPSEKDIIKIICKILKMNSNSLVKIDNYTNEKLGLVSSIRYY